MDERIISLLRGKKSGLSFRGIWKELGLPAGERAALRKRLRILESQGTVRRLKSRFLLPPKANVIKGRLVSLIKGYGFVTPGNGNGEDIFIPARRLGGALQGDRVEVFLARGRGGKPEGRILRILEKGRKDIIGLYIERAGRPFFLPIDSLRSVELPLVSTAGFSPQPGMLIAVDRDGSRLTGVFGHPDDPGVDVRVIIRKHNLAESFSTESLQELQNVPSILSGGEETDRADFRGWTTVTIDGEDAQDFDDAVSVTRLETRNYLLGVHIADVSHYVHPGTALDGDAFMRGTSIYFPGLTLPMLPEKLSTDICSLKPGAPRLAFSVLLEIDASGQVVKADFTPSLIQTSARLTYTSVYKIFQGDEEERRKLSRLVPDLHLMRELAGLLREKRDAEGSLNFDLPEPELVYRDGQVLSIGAFEQNEAHRLIEEFMVAANEAVASRLHRAGIPSLYRIHPRPALSEMEKLSRMLAGFGIVLSRTRKLESRDLQFILKSVEGKPEEKFIHIRVLRSLKLAVYSDECAGHFGLAKKEYTHFTSPIRRYPDLVVHRILKQATNGGKSRTPGLEAVALHCSQRERAADEAERELLEWRIYRFLKGMLGEELEGIVVDISRDGPVVELDRYFVSGIISYRDLLVGGPRKSRGRAARIKPVKPLVLGQRVKVVLASVDPLMRRMNFVLSRPQGES